MNNNNNIYAENIKNYLFNSNVSSPVPNPPNLFINRSLPLSPHLNNYQQYLFQQKYSPIINPHFNNNNINYNLIPNNFRPMPNHNSFFSATPNYPLSPLPPQPQQIFGSPQPNININNINTFSPLSNSLIMMKMPNQGPMIQAQPLSVNSPFNTSGYSSPYLGPNINGNTTSLNNSSNNRKNSASFQNENKLNSNLNRNVYNNNQHHTPLIMRGNDEEILNRFMSPKSMGPSTSFNLGNNANLVNLNLNVNKINGSMYQLNPMNNINQMKQQMNQMGNINQMGNVIPMTIRQKIFEKRKKEEVDRINKLLNTMNMNRIRPNNNNNINVNNMNNNFNNSSTNNSMRANIIKNNLIPNISNIQNINITNTTNINNFNNIRANKNIQNIQNIHNLQNNPNIQNMISMSNNINLNMNNMNNINRVTNNSTNCQMNLNHENMELSEKQKIQHLFIIENQNKTNFDIFLKSVTPFYKMTKDVDFSKLKIHTIFDNMKLMSLLGLKTIYYNNGELLDIWYSLSFSSFVIKIINKQLITKIFEEIKVHKKDLENIILNQNEEIKIIESLFTLYLTTEYLEITFTESKPDYSRKSYNTIIKLLKKSIPFFEQISIEDIDINKSFFLYCIHQ